MKEFVTALCMACIPIFVVYIGKILYGIEKFIKSKYNEIADTQSKKEIVTIAVKAVEQLYKTLGGEEKLEKAKETVLNLLDEKGIEISELELNTYIESIVQEFNKCKSADIPLNPEISEQE